MISLAARREAMHAAEQVDTHSIREAAVLGGIVRSIIATGHCEGECIARYAHVIIGEFTLVGVDRPTPCPTEIGMVLERFEERDDPPLID